jgi:medium-chain acyl-[acyl-carrier-protein] hydrolase
VSSKASSSWFVHHRPAGERALSLFCFPPAGSGPSLFHSWHESMAGQVEVVAVNLPGRETRFTEAPISEMGQLVDELGIAFRDESRRPYALLGSCMGGLVAFEVCRYLRRHAWPLPSHLFILNQAAPQIPMTQRHLHDLPLDQLIRELLFMGSEPGVLEDRELMELLEPSLRSDFALYETYFYVEESPLITPITVLGDIHNTGVSFDSLSAWREQTSGPFRLELISFEGFAVKRFPTNIASTLLEILANARLG